MRKSLMMPLLGLVFLISFVPTIVLAQEKEETEYSWGTVTSISNKQIVLTEYDYDSDEKTDVAYALAPNVRLDNVSSLKDITVGDDVWVEYVVNAGKKAVVAIEVTTSSDQEYMPYEEYTPSQTDEEEFDYSSEEAEY